MELKIKETEDKSFKPFTIEIKVDTLREATILKMLTNNRSALTDFLKLSTMNSAVKDVTSNDLEFDGIFWLIDEHLKNNQ